MSALFLTPNELHELTGAQKKSKQKEVLRKNRIAFVERSNGTPVVMRATFTQPALVQSIKPQPKMDAI